MTKSQTIHFILPFIAFIFLSACATHKKQSTSDLKPASANSEPVYSFYIAGGIGNVSEEGNTNVLKLLKSHLEKASDKSTLIFTGDNIPEDDDNWEKDKAYIDRHIALTQNFKGNTIFIPGNNEWKSYNTKKIEKFEEYLDDLDKENLKFYPKNVCPIEHKVINDDLDLIIIDSKWFVSNWSRIENINKKCTDIVTRRRFLEELEGYINDGQGKNIVIAMHHPIFSNGIYAGKTTLKSNLLPLPILGSIQNGILNLGAFSPDLLNSKRYNYLRILVSSYAKASDRITIVSGHEESLQYLEGGNIHQIISGSLNNSTATKLSKDRINTVGGSLEFQGK